MEENLAIIIPVFNEETSIKEVIDNLAVFIRRHVKDFKIIAIDDGSKDNALSILNDMRSFYPELIILSHKNNKGYGAAIKTGVNFADKEWVLIMDSDGQYSIEDFLPFWHKREDYDFILGYRLKRADNFYRKGLERIGNFVANFFLRGNIKDINCGFKLFRARDLKALSLLSASGTISFEIIYNLLKSKMNFCQIPVRHYRRKTGKQTGGSPKVILNTIWEATKIVFS